MRNTLFYMVILFLVIVSYPIFSIAGSSPRPPREPQTLIGKLSHQWNKHNNPLQYATNSRHKEILKWLQNVSQKKNFYADKDYWHHKERSMKRTLSLGAEIITQINLRNREQLRNILNANQGGLPLFLEQALQTIATNQIKKSPDPLPDLPPGSEDVISKFLGALAKSSDEEAYVLGDTITKRGEYLLELSQTPHCYDSQYHTEIERGLSSMSRIWYFIKKQIEEKNTDLAQRTLNNGQNLLPRIHCLLFQRAIDDLRQKETDLLSEFELYTEEAVRDQVDKEMAEPQKKASDELP